MLPSERKRRAKGLDEGRDDADRSARPKPLRPLSVGHLRYRSSRGAGIALVVHAQPSPSLTNASTSSSSQVSLANGSHHVSPDLARLTSFVSALHPVRHSKRNPP